MRHGDGEYTSSPNAEDGSNKGVYRGKWVENQKHGIGKQSYPGVGDYYGYWENNLRHGEGVMSYTNKDLYSGNWAQGQKHGKGTYSFAETREKYVGHFAKGQMVSGKWLMCNGDFFEGSFDNNKPKGAGEWSFKNGNKVQGVYRQTRSATNDADDIQLSWSTTQC